MTTGTGIKRMGHSAIHVADVEKALGFYRDIVGLSPKWTGDDDWGQVSVGADDLSLVRKTGAVHPPHIGFRIATREDLVKFHQRLTDKGVAPESIKLHRDATESFYFRDLDGNWLEALWDPAE